MGAYLLLRFDLGPPVATVRRALHRVSRDHSGVTAVEYALMAAGIAGAIIAIVFLVGDDIAALFQDIATRINSAASKLPFP